MNSNHNGHLAVRDHQDHISRYGRASRSGPIPHEVTAQEVWEVLRKRKVTFFACLLAASLAALALSLLLPRRYEGVVRLMVDSETSNAIELPTLVQAAGVDPETKLQTHVNVIQSDSLAWEVVKRLRLDQRPEAAHRRFLIGPAECLSSAGEPLSSIGPECRRTLLDEFHQRLHVQSIPRTELIDIRYRSQSRELAALVANTLADAYMEDNFQTKYQAGVRASTWLSGQLEDVRSNAEAAEEKFLAYQKQTGIIGTDENHNVLLERLNATNQHLVSAKANRIVHEARYRVAQTGDPEALVELLAGTPLQLLRAQEISLKNEYAQLDSKYGEDYPRVVEVKAQLDKAAASTKIELARVREKLKDEYESALKSETLLNQEFEKQRLDAYNTNRAAIKVALLKRDVDASRELYEQLAKKLKEAGILAGLKAANVAVVDPAAISVSPVEPHTGINLGLGMMVGTLGGLILSFLRENLDTTITTLSDVSEVGSLPSLAIVPRLTDGVGGALTRSMMGKSFGEIVALDHPESMAADAYRSLRTALLLSNADHPPKVLLITSPLPREGKTTSCVNTAVVFAQKSHRVLLVDGDMRRSDVHRCLKLAPTGGLSEALSGEDPSNLYVGHVDLPSLTVLPAGKRPAKPPDLLDSERMRELIKRWHQEFDQVIIDAPPLIGMSDAVILATMADMVVLVLRANQSRRQDLNHAQEILASVDANVGGAILNDFDLGLGYYGETPSLYGRYFNETGKGWREKRARA